MNGRERLRDAINRSGKKHSVIAWEAGITRAMLRQSFDRDACATEVRNHHGNRSRSRRARRVGMRGGRIQPRRPQRAKVRTVAGILMDMTRSNPHDPR
jgi:hypothetical protein